MGSFGASGVNELDANQNEFGRSFPGPEESLPACFQRIVALHRNRIALGSGTWQPNYEELNVSANRIAHALIVRGGSPGDRVAILMRHDAPLIAAMLAILKAGRIVVALNPADPPARLRQVLANADANLILSDAGSGEIAAEAAENDRSIIRVAAVSNEMPTHNPGNSISPDSTAFLVYTSGSTGQPKAVMQTHRQILQKVARLFRDTGVGATDRIALLAALSGGQGIGTAWCALTNGAALCLFPVTEKGVTGLADWINDQGITLYLSSASLFRNLCKTLAANASFPNVRVVMVASEVATSVDFNAFQRHFAERCLFFHTLSSSETGNIAQLRLARSDRIAEGRLPVGRAAEGIEIFLRDEEGHEVRQGETGEIVVRSRFLSAGYWRDAELTAERFSKVPGTDGVWEFRSGDLGCISKGGLLVFIGRKDARLKIRGYRIEVSEVEQALQSLPGIERAAVGPIDRPNKEPMLAAYVVLSEGCELSAEKLRQELRAILPRHMVPSVFIFLDDLPLNTHGKVDREKLRQNQPARESNSAAPTDTDTERLLAGIWMELFEIEQIGREDDFFDLGGDSLLAATVAAKVYETTGIELNLGTFVDHPVLADLAGAIDGMREAAVVQEEPALAPRQPGDLPPLSFLQERIWRSSRTPQQSEKYTVARSYRIRGRLDAGLLRECLDDLAQCHEILRTTYAEVNGRAVQIVHPPGPVALEIVDLSDSDKEDPEAEARLFCRQKAASIFDLSRLPLLRFFLIRIREDEHWFARVNHGIIADGWSWQIFFRELAALYEARPRGNSSPLSASPRLQFADYAVWQRNAMDPNGVRHRSTVAWWKDFLRKSPRPAKRPFRRRKHAQAVAPGDGVVRFGLSPEVSQRLEEIGRGAGATYYMVRVAVFAAMLAAETGQSDITIGGFVTRRNRIALQDVMGLFGNQVRMRFRCDQREPFGRWLTRVQEVILETEARSDVPYEQLRDALELQGVRLRRFHVWFNIFQFPSVTRFAGITIEDLEWFTELMPGPFVINFNQYNESEDCRATFDAGYYDPERVRELVDRLCKLFDVVSRNPDRSVGELLAMSGVRQPSTIRSFLRAIAHARSWRPTIGSRR
ncbi:MAG: condensation domain-containing protein [Xanthobacteraceae bacterium]